MLSYEGESQLDTFAKEARLDDEGRPLDQCPACGCPTWREAAPERWCCDHCDLGPNPSEAEPLQRLAVNG